MSKKIKLLFIAANPTDVSRLRQDEELHEISKSIRMSGSSNSINLISEWAVRPADLQDALLRYRPHIVHISAHSGKEGGIWLERDDIASSRAISHLTATQTSTGARANFFSQTLEARSGGAADFSLQEKSCEEEKLRGVSVHSLTGLFSALKGNIQLVFLNSCYTEQPAAAISQFINYTIGISTLIGDKAATILAASFYSRLASGLSVKTSFELAVNHLELLNDPHAESPLLFVREGISCSKPFMGKSKRNFSALKIKGNAEERTNSLIITDQIRGVAANSSIGVKKNKKKKDNKKVTNKRLLAEADKGDIGNLLLELKSLLERLYIKISE